MEKKAIEEFVAKAQQAKSPEALADEALDAVAGGGGSWAAESPDIAELLSPHECSNCHKSVSGDDAYKRSNGMWYCKTCWYQLSGWYK